MNKLDLIEALKQKVLISRSNASNVVDCFFNSIEKALINNERVEIRGLCSFYLKHYEGHKGINPRTGESLVVSPKKLPYFKCSKELKDRINQ